jgi:DNA-binding response OmpR family regulator
VKVLVVDDVAVAGSAHLGIQLQWEDAEVVTAADGEEGLQRFVEQDPDVVLLDVTMPRMSGLELLRLVRRVSEVPVVMLSARGEDIDQARGLEMGADDHILKPFSHLALMAAYQIYSAPCRASDPR